MTQQDINNIAYKHFLKALNELPKEARSNLNKRQLKQAGARQLRSCTAWVWETPHYYVLQSYETFIACIEKASDICCDVLRTEYGYTATSAKHVSIFRKGKCYGGYSSAPWGCDTTLTTKNITKFDRYGSVVVDMVTPKQ